MKLIVLIRRCAFLFISIIACLSGFSQPALVTSCSLNISVATTSSTCGGSNGNAAINVSGGTSPYNYSINNGTTFQSSNTFNGLVSGNYVATVKDNAGCMKDTAFTISNADSLPAPVVKTSQPVCLGMYPMGTITVTSPAPGSGYTYVVKGAGSTYTNTTGIFNGLFGFNTYNVTAINSSGCSSKVTSLYLYVIAAPGVTIVQPTCSVPTATVTLEYQGPDAMYSIGGDFQTSNVFTGVVPGDYYFAQTKSSECMSPHDDRRFGVLPIVTTPKINAGGISTICPGGNVTITSDAASGNQWYKDGVAISGANGSGLLVTASGNYTVKVTKNGCESAPSNTITITLNNPVSPATITANGATTFCQGATVTLTSSAASGNQWYRDGVPIIGANTTTLGVNSGGNYTVIVAVNGCSSSASNAIPVTVNSTIPTPTITAGTTTTFCQGGSVTLTSNAASGNQWYKDGVAINGANATTLNANSSGSYTVIVSVNGCSSSFSNTIVITVNTAPVPGAITGATLVCVGSSQIYSIPATTGATGYTWTLPSGWSGTSITNAITTTAGSSDGTISVTANNSCGSSALRTLPVRINPTPTITLNGDTMLISSPAPNYQWFQNNMAMAGEVFQKLRVRQMGFYRVETSPDKSCWTASLDFPILFQPPFRIADNITTEIYPNPAVGFFNVIVRLPRLTTVIAYVTVSDVSGNIVLQTNKLLFYGNEIKIPITLNVSGTFFVKVNVNGDEKTMPVILQ